MAAHFEYMTTDGGAQLEPLISLLNGVQRKSDRPELWARIVTEMSPVLDGRCQIEAAVSSPNGDHLAVCVQTKNWFGLKTRQAGLLYAIRDQAAVGRIVPGKRDAEGWVLEKVF